MKLRHKFGILALIYVVSLSVNLVMSGWCIVTYFQSAFVDFQSTLLNQSETERLRALVRAKIQLLDSQPVDQRAVGDYEHLRRALSSSFSRLQADLSAGFGADDWVQLQAKAKQANETADRLVTLQHRDTRQSVSVSATDEARQHLTHLDRLLGGAGGLIGQHRHQAMERATETQREVVSILIANTACGALLCVVGVLLVRRWVLVPVAVLRQATKEISEGNFSYRIQPQSGDELGQLSREVNQMSTTIVEMQTKLVEQERLAAAGEMVARLAHNIRNPLAGIRGLAEATVQAESVNEEIVHNQQRIIGSVDRFERWLRDLQQSVSPMKLNIQPVRIDELIHGVCTALQPMADRRNVRIEVLVDDATRHVKADSFHIEQALVALLTNALQASRSGQVVKVSVCSAPDDRSGRWELTVQDEGTGIPTHLKKKIFQPYFTTKPDGNGVGLAMANKVIKIHGGQLTVESEPGHGSCFHAFMPGLVNQSDKQWPTSS